MNEQELGGEEFTPAGKIPQQLVQRVQQRMQQGKKLTNQEMHWAFAHGGFYFHQRAGVHNTRMRMQEEAGLQREKQSEGVGGNLSGEKNDSSQAQRLTASPLSEFKATEQNVNSSQAQQTAALATASPLQEVKEEKPLTPEQRTEAQKENGQVTPLDATKNAVEQPVAGVVQPKAEETEEEKRRKEKESIKVAAEKHEAHEKEFLPDENNAEVKKEQEQKEETKEQVEASKKEVEKENKTPEVKPVSENSKPKETEKKPEGVENAEDTDPGPEGVKEDYENPPPVAELEMKDAQDEAGEVIEGDEFTNNNLTGLTITAQQFRDQGKAAVDHAKEQTKQRLSVEQDVKKLEGKIAASDKSLTTAETNTNQREKNLKTMDAPLKESKNREQKVAGEVGVHINTYNENKDEAEDMRHESADMLGGSKKHEDPEDEDSGMLSEKYEELSSGSATMADGISGGGDTAKRLKAEAEAAKKKNADSAKQIQDTQQKLQQSKQKLNEEKNRNQQAKKNVKEVRAKLEKSKKDEQKLTKEGMDLMKTSFDIENETQRAQYFYYKNMAKVSSRENLLNEEAQAFEASLLNQGGTDGLLFNYVKLESEDERNAFVDSLSPTQRVELQTALEAFMANYDAWVAANQEQLMLKAEEKRLTQIDAHNTNRTNALKKPLQRVTDNLSKVDKIGLFWSSLTQGLDAIWKSITNITWADVGNFALAMVNPVEFFNTVSGSVKAIWTELSDWGGFEKDPVGMILKKGSAVGVQLLTICGVITGLLFVLSIAASIGTFFTGGAMIGLAGWLWSATATMGTVTFWVGVVTAALSVLSGIKNAYEMHTAKTAEVLFQNTAELKQDAGNTSIAILAIIGGKGQVSGAKQMLEMIQKYPKTFGKRMFLEMKKSFMRKLTWAPRTVAAMFKKDTWKSLYASLRKYLSRQTDELTENKSDRDLRRDPVRENVEDKKTGTNKKNEKVKNDKNETEDNKQKTDRTADEQKADDNFEKREGDVDDAQKKKLKEDADKDVPDGPDSANKRRALFMAKVITEANDKIDTPVAGLLAELAPLSAMKGVPPFKAEAKGDGVYDIWMNPPVKDGYTDGEEDKKPEKPNESGAREANEEEVDKINNDRKLYNVSKKKNIAKFEGEIDGNNIDLVSVSGEKQIEGTVDAIPFEDQKLTTQPTKSDKLQSPDALDRRAYDSEAKGLENLLSRTNPDSKGKIRLISERNLCGSCNDVVKQFSKLRPNIEIELVYVKPYYNPL
ncbi:MAG: hypothetical protein IM638_12815 [Bacteroidetes bacterium]|nr:hypothetical protein [Bacteroidota bacterium]